MKTTASNDQLPSESIKEIPTWTRRYARNQTLPFLLSLFVCLIWSFLARSGAKLAIQSFRAGHIMEFCLAMAIVAALVSFIIWFIVPHWGGRWVRKLTKRIFNDHGDVVLAVSATQKTRIWPHYLLAGMFLVGVPISVILTHWGYLPYGYLQPVSAIYAAPVMIAMFISMRSTLSLIFLLWPILYCTHAIFVVVGAPIQFAGEWRVLNLLIPTVGYGVLTGVVGYLFGQYSLKRVRDIASGGETRP